MFDVRLRNGLVFKKMMDSIKELFPDGKWFCSSSGMSLEAMDVSQTSVVKLSITREAFDAYRCDRDITFGMNIKSLAKILKYAKNEDRIRIRTSYQMNKIQISVEPMIETDWTEYEMILKDLNITQMDTIPEASEEATIIMPSTKLHRICQDLSQIGNCITIAFTKRCGARFHSRGEIGSGCVYLYPTLYCDEPNEEIIFKVKEPMTQCFSLRQMIQLTKATAVAPQSVLKLRTMGPMELVYDIPDQQIIGGNRFITNPNPIASIIFYLSPIIDLEE